MNANGRAVAAALAAGLSHVYQLFGGPVPLSEWEPRGASPTAFAGSLTFDPEQRQIRATDSRGFYLCSFLLLTPEQAALYPRRPVEPELLCGPSFRELRERPADLLERRGKVLGVDP